MIIEVEHKNASGRPIRATYSTATFEVLPNGTLMVRNGADNVVAYAAGRWVTVKALSG